VVTEEGLLPSEYQGHVAVDSFGLQLLACLRAFECRSELYEYAFAVLPEVVLKFEEVFGLEYRAFDVERLLGIDFGRD